MLKTDIHFTGIKLIVADDCDEAGHIICEMFKEVIKNRRNALLGLATGSTPCGLYQNLAEGYAKGEIDFSEVRTINLDEYSGLCRTDKNSFGHFMDEQLFSRINIRPENIMLISGEKDPRTEIERYDSFLAENRTDIQILGLGENGHIGFNEPGDYFIAGTHEVELADDTIRANARFFSDISEVPRRAVTMGVNGILNAERIVLAAYGKKKADAVKRLLSDNRIYPELPCSILKAAHDVTVVIDRELYSCIGG